MTGLPLRAVVLSFVGATLAAGVASAQNPAAAPAQIKSPTILWAQCAGEPVPPPTTLAQLAEAARPVLWFSRDEPMLELNKVGLPSEWPRTGGRPPALERQVYYRVTRLKSSRQGDIAATLRTHLPADQRSLVTSNSAHPEAIANIPLDSHVLDNLLLMDIRYLFYYPNEFGVGRHPHDFETIDLQIVVELADRLGNPWNDDPSERVCRQIRVTRFYGSAHGLGAYTNTLNLDKILRDWIKEPVGTPFTDPFWPLLVFVEEGKHASAPDRNGDGVFTPGFDVNKYESDAWGVRDTMRANFFVRAFSHDTFKQRIPEIKTEEGSDGRLRVVPANPDDKAARAAFAKFVSGDYLLRRATEDADICGPVTPFRPVSDRKRALEEYDAQLTAELTKKGKEPGHPAEKLKERDFCGNVDIDRSFDIVDIGNAVRWGGSSFFARIGETFTVSVRFDGSLGWTALSPMEYEIPVVGGRIVGRLASEGLSFGKHGLWDLKSVDLLYMRSAARFSDFYVGVGVDDRPPPGRPVDRPAGAPRFDKALELGFRIRIPISRLGMFLGGRIGVRANDFTSLRNIRLVTEFGSAIW